MGTTAIICELNPLHNGHLHLMNEAKKNGDTVVLIMSGNFTQRAGSAICQKYARARTAVKCGANLVLELPFPYSSAGAEFFAHAGAELAEKIGADRLMFGSESGDMSMLRRIAEVTSSPEYARLFADYSEKYSSEGVAQIRQRILASLIEGYPTDRSIAPNDVLATQYIRFAHMECEAVCRIETPSASHIRRIGGENAKAFIPSETYEMLTDTPLSQNDLLRTYLWQYIRMNEIPDCIAEAKGGLGHRLRTVARASSSAEEFFERCKTKKYTNSRILRAALFSALGIRAEDVRTMPKFTTVLGSDEKGFKILSEMRNSSDFAVITKPSSYKNTVVQDKILARQLDLQMKSDELYTMLFDKPMNAEFFLTQTPYIHKSGGNENVNGK